MRNVKFVVGLILLLGLPLFSQNSANLEALKKEAIQQVDARQVFTQQMVDQIFSYAELGFQEFETSRYVTDILDEEWFQGRAGSCRHTYRVDGDLRLRQTGDCVYHAISTASRAHRRNQASRITIRSSKARRATAKDITQAWP